MLAAPSYVLPGMQHEAAARLQERRFGGQGGKNESGSREHTVADLKI